METSNICDVCQGRSFVLSSEGYYICHICGARSSYSSGTVTIGYQDAVGPVTRIKQASVSNISQLRNQQLSSDQIDEKIKRAKQQYFLVPQDYIVAFQGLLQSQILFLVSQEVGIQPQIALVIGDIWTRYLSLLRVGALKGVQPELSISIILIALLIIRSPYTINDLIFWITKVPSEKRMPYFDFWKRLPVGSFGSKRRFHPQNPPTVSLIVSRTRNLLRVLQPLEIPPPNSLALYLRLIKYLGLPNPVNQLGIHLLQIPLQLLKRKIRKDNEKSIECNKDFFLNPLPYITAIICTTLRISYTVDCLYSNDVQRRIDDIPSWSEMVEQLLSLRSSYFAGEFIRTPHFINQIHPTATSSTSSRAFKMISPIIRTSASEDLHGLCFGGRSCEPICSIHDYIKQEISDVSRYSQDSVVNWELNSAMMENDYEDEVMDDGFSIYSKQENKSLTREGRRQEKIEKEKYQSEIQKYQNMKDQNQKKLLNKKENEKEQETNQNQFQSSGYFSSVEPSSSDYNETNNEINNETNNEINNEIKEQKEFTGRRVRVRFGQKGKQLFMQQFSLFNDIPFQEMADQEIQQQSNAIQGCLMPNTVSDKQVTSQQQDEEIEEDSFQNYLMNNIDNSNNNNITNQEIKDKNENQLQNQQSEEPQIDRVKEDYRKTALVRRVLQLLANYPELKIHPDFANILNKQYPTLQLDMNQTFQSLPQQLFGDNLDPSLFIFGIPPLRVYGALRQRRRRRLEKQIYDNDTDDSIGQESDINNEDQTDQEDYGDIDTQSINQENRNDTTLQHHLFNIFVPGEDQRPFPPPLSLLIDCICTRIFGISVNSFEILNLMKVIELHCFSAMPRVQEHSRGNCDSDIAHVSFTPNFPSEQQFLQQAETRMHRALHGSIMQYPNEFMDSLNIGWKRNNEQT